MKSAIVLGIGAVAVFALVASRKPEASEIGDSDAIKILAIMKRRVGMMMKGEKTIALWAMIPTGNEEGPSAADFIAGLLSSGFALYVRKDADFSKSFAIVASPTEYDPWHYSLFLNAEKLLRIGKGLR